jgi:hypothetical protein
MRSTKLFILAALVTLSSSLISASSTTNSSMSKSNGPAKCNPYWDLENRDPDTGEVLSTLHFNLARAIHDHSVDDQIKFLLSHGWKIVGGGCE